MEEKATARRESAWQREFFTAILAAMVFVVGLAVGPMNNDLRHWYALSRYTFWMEMGFVLLYFLFGRSPWAMLSEYWRKSRRVVVVSLLWVATVLLSYLSSDYYSPGNILAVMRVEETLGHFLFFVVLLDAVSRYRIDTRWLIGALILSAFLVWVYFFVGLVKVNFSSSGWLPELPIVDGWAINGNIRRVGYEMEAAVLATIPFLLFGRGRTRIVLGLVTLAMLWLMFWLGGRASMLGVLVGILSMGFFVGWKRTLVVAGIYLLLFASIGFVNQKISRKATGHLPAKIQQSLKPHSVHRFTSGRDDVWRLVFRELKKSPLIGNGPQSYYFYPKRRKEAIHAHNFLIQFLGEWGIVGAGLFLYLIYLALKRWFENLKKEVGESVLLDHLAGWMIVVGLTVSGFFGGIYFFTQTVFLVLISLSIFQLRKMTKTR